MIKLSARRSLEGAGGKPAVQTFWKQQWEHSLFGKRRLTVTPPGLTLSKDRTLERKFLAFLI